MALNDELLGAPINIIAPTPSGNFTNLRASEKRIRELAKLGRFTDIFAFFYNLCGRSIPVNNFGYHEEKTGSIFADHWGGLKHTHTIFKGIKRPFRDTEQDSAVYIYVVCPAYVYRHIPDMVCAAKRYPAPSNSVFVAYVIFDNDAYGAGVVTNWEWVLCDTNNKRLPSDYLNRYETKVWENG